MRLRRKPPRYEDFTEATVNMTKFMYACPNVSTRYRIVRLDRSVPIWMRGPGEATGAFALESAMDEMAHKLNLDPIEFRLRNYTETDPEHNRPYSSKHLKEAYQKGAEAIGWNNRKPQPGSLREGNWLIGYGYEHGRVQRLPVGGFGPRFAKDRRLADAAKCGDRHRAGNRNRPDDDCPQRAGVYRLTRSRLNTATPLCRKHPARAVRPLFRRWDRRFSMPAPPSNRR